MSAKLEALKGLSFGKRVAEDEAVDLAAYFLETEQFRVVLTDEADIVYGQKGAGKSALYFALQSRDIELLERNILLIAGENPGGNPAFKDLVSLPPTSEKEFTALWKLYFLSLISQLFIKAQVQNEDAKFVINKLREEGLLPTTKSLSSLVRAVLDYARNLVRLESITGTAELNEAGYPSLSTKISLREPSTQSLQEGFISIESLFERANAALAASRLTAWICLDRLDVAFAETAGLERNALRALFRVYTDLRYDFIRLKIFLRSDIWKRVNEGGFREGSHITRTSTLTWTPNDLMNLVIRRVVRSDAICRFYSIDKTAVSGSFEAQKTLFYKIFPDVIHKSTAFEWILANTRDGTGVSAPREVLHLLSKAKEIQIRKLEQGQPEPSETWLFDKSSIREALNEVSQVRLQQTIYTEFPAQKNWIEALRGEKAEQSVETLAKIWKVKDDEARETAAGLAEIGVFSVIGKENPRFKIPFLYREFLEIIQGKAKMEGQGDTPSLKENEEESDEE